MLVSLSLVATRSFAMQTDLKPWVQAATHIKVRTMTQKMTDNVQIDDKSTVFDVKNKLHNLEGIPTDQQSISPLWTSWHTLWLLDRTGDKLNDNQSIKQIMNTFNTDRFLLCLSLRKQNSK